MNGVQRALTLSVLIITVYSGCNRGPVSSISTANFKKINSDGTESLAAAEKIIGFKATETQADAIIANHRRILHTDDLSIDVVEAMMEKLKGKRKLKLGTGIYAVADENGTAVKWFQWEDGDKTIYVAVLDDKVFFKFHSGLAK